MAVARLRAALRDPYLIASVALIALVTGIIEWQYTLNPVPPGVDPGDWLVRSYPYIHRGYPPQLAIGSPYLYPPVIFPLLGGAVALAGGPVSGAFLFAGALWVAFGLGSAALAWFALERGPFRLAFVALSMLNGTLLSMMFWGAYPNLAAFVLLDLGILALVAFLRGESARAAAGIWVAAALLYLTHSLTFDLFLAVLALTALGVALAGRFRMGWLRNRGHLVGLVILVATVVAYTEITSWLGIPHPDYYFSNPAAYVVDNLGEIFAPLASAPAVSPPGSAVFLAPHGAAVLLLAVGALALALPALVGRVKPSWLGPAGLVAGGWLAAVLIVPAAGYLAHIDTDYTRFLYFLPQPIALAALVVLDTALGVRSEIWAAPAGAVPAPVPAPGRRRPSVVAVLVHGALVIGILVLLVNVTLPVAQAWEADNTGTAHDAPFLDAVGYLAHDPTKGSVLTVQGATRWIEALTGRGAYDNGPTWLLFENWQVANSEEAYWALNSLVALTDDRTVFSYSNLSTPLLDQAPMYSAYVLGVAVPVLRLLPGATWVNVTRAGVSQSITLGALGAPNLTFSPGPSPTGRALYQTAGLGVEEDLAFAPGGVAWLNLTLRPSNGTALSAAAVGLGPPPPSVPALHAAPATSVALSPDGGFVWRQAPSLGLLPDPVNLTTTGAFAPRPAWTSANTSGLPGTLSFGFSGLASEQPWRISLELATPAASNPAATLPPVLWTSDFLHHFGVHFLVLPAGGGNAQTVAFYQVTYQYRIVFQNSEWLVLSG